MKIITKVEVAEVNQDSRAIVYHFKGGRIAELYTLDYDEGMLLGFCYKVCRDFGLTNLSS